MTNNEDLAQKAVEAIWDYVTQVNSGLRVRSNKAMEVPILRAINEATAERDAEIARLKHRERSLWHGMPAFIREKLAEFSTNDPNQTYVDLVDAAISEIARLRRDALKKSLEALKQQKGKEGDEICRETTNPEAGSMSLQSNAESQTSDPLALGELTKSEEQKVLEFMKEWDEGKHQLSQEDEDALERAKPELERRLKEKLDSASATPRFDAIFFKRYDGVNPNGELQDALCNGFRQLEQELTAAKSEVERMKKQVSFFKNGLKKVWQDRESLRAKLILSERKLKVSEEALKSIKDYCEADIMYNSQDIDCIHESSRRALATIRSNSS